MSGTPRINPALRYVHRWLALTLGAILTLVSLSGSLLLFQEHFFRWAHGHMIPPDLPQEIGSLDRWVENANERVPRDFYGPFILYAPHVDHNLSNAGMLYYTNPEPGGFVKQGFAGVLVEPATGKALGTIDIDRSPAYAPLALHESLWSGETGGILVGITALGALIMLPLGLYLWWPTRQRVVRKLSPRPWRATLTNAGRLHDVAGGWAVLVLILLAATGLYLAQDEWVEPLLTAVVGPAHGAPSEPSACAGPIGHDEALRRGRALVPSGRWIMAEAVENDSMRHWRFTFKTGESVRQQTHVLADMQCGAVSLESTPATRSARESAELWLTTLHEGTAFGQFGQILFALIGLVPLLMLWSGVRMWMRRRGWLLTSPRTAPDPAPRSA